MKKPNESMAMLDMFMHPVFRVKDGVICEVNSHAEQYQVTPGTQIKVLIAPNEEEYAAFEGGCLSLCVRIDGMDYIATVFRTDDGDVFHLQSTEESPELRIMTLVAQQLRCPLSEVMTAADALFSKDEVRGSDENREQAGLISKGLYQLLREIGNMSAVSTYRQGRLYGKETTNIVAVINETLEKAQTLCNRSSQRLAYTALWEDVYCAVDTEMLERALYNLISNAVKFSPADSAITAKLSLGQNKLRFTIQSKITDPALTQGNLFMRYVRDASVEDGRHGIGLGIPLTQFAAAAHNGTLLMDQPAEDTIRFTMTLSTINNKGPVVSTPFPAFDYMGGWDHSLVELSDVLPSSAYENK